jgi:hypothetical protein
MALARLAVFVHILSIASYCYSGAAANENVGPVTSLRDDAAPHAKYGTGGPKQAANLYTRAMLEQAFSGFCEMKITEEEREIHEGASHGGMSAVINFTARKPQNTRSSCRNCEIASLRAVEKPLRQRSSFQSNPFEVVAGILQHCQQGFRLARNLHFPNDLAHVIHNTDAGFLDRYVQSSKMVHAVLLLLMLEAVHTDLVEPSA